MALHADPERRYGSALEMAQAVTAGARGEDTEATMRLAAAAYEDDARHAGSAAHAVRAPDRPDDGRAASPSRERAPERRPAARAQAARRRPPRRNRAGRLLLALLLLVGRRRSRPFAAVSAMDGGGIDAPNESDVRGQVQELKSLIREHTE